jgi:aspartate carbamoyltransferase regulatory subunit
MGDTYFIKEIKCAYCGKMNNFEDVDEFFRGLSYSFEFGQDFICKYCNKKNKVIMDFVAIKVKSKNKKRK